MDIANFTDRQLLLLYSNVMEQLRVRKIVRSSNGPGADYAESLVAKAFGLTLNKSSTAGFDGVNAQGMRFEVKCRRLTPYNSSRQLSAIRGLEKAHFDVLVGILFDTDFKILRAALIPYAIVKDQSTFVKQTNSWKFMLRDSVWTLPGVEDITRECREAQQWE